MQFVQVDATGRPEPLDDEPDDEPMALARPVVSTCGIGPGSCSISVIDVAGQG